MFLFKVSSNNFTSEKSIVVHENKMDAKQKLKETLKTNNPRLVKVFEFFGWYCRCKVF